MGYNVARYTWSVDSGDDFSADEFSKTSMNSLGVDRRRGENTYSREPAFVDTLLDRRPKDKSIECISEPGAIKARRRSSDAENFSASPTPGDGTPSR